MKILIKGIGSIGKRHLTNLIHLGYHNIVLISSKSEFESIINQLPVYTSVEQACRYHSFTHGLICSPTAVHHTDLVAFVNAGIKKIYLEKPVSHQNSNFDFVKPFISDGGQIFVGYDLHFDSGMIKVHELITKGIIGKVLSANAFVGQYLPDWRPFEDHRKGMSASIEKGGGVMLDLVHEFDYLCRFFGEPGKVASFYQHNKSLEIETEDVADVLIKFSSGVTATIHLDYHQPKLIRNCVFTGTYGTIIWDLAEKKVSCINSLKEVIDYDFSQFDRNDRFVSIIKAFMDGDQDNRLTDFNQGLISLKLVLAAKKSNDSNLVVNFMDLK